MFDAIQLIHSSQPRIILRASELCVLAHCQFSSVLQSAPGPLPAETARWCCLHTPSTGTWGPLRTGLGLERACVPFSRPLACPRCTRRRRDRPILGTPQAWAAPTWSAAWEDPRMATGPRVMPTRTRKGDPRPHPIQVEDHPPDSGSDSPPRPRAHPCPARAAPGEAGAASGQHRAAFAAASAA